MMFAADAVPIPVRKPAIAVRIAIASSTIFLTFLGSTSFCDIALKFKTYAIITVYYPNYYVK